MCVCVIKTSKFCCFYFFLVGNKNDDPSLKVVLTKDAQRVAELMKIQMFETSAKENINVEEMFLAITKMVLRTKKEQLNRQTNENLNLIAIKTKGNIAV